MAVAEGTSLSDRVLQGDHRALARAVTLIERGDSGVPSMLSALYPAAGRAAVLGVTGPAGSGKSTLVSRIAAGLRQRGKSVGILAVDPSSAFTGGALLGDRIRMLDLAGDDGVFIRSMGTRGAIGGLARAAADAATVLDAAGTDVVILETVGVGQAEVDVVSMAQTVLVVSVPGLGDGIQALKAGLLEIADVHVVNKADRPGAEHTAKELVEMLRLRRREPGQWNVPVQLSSATNEEGVDQLVDSIEKHRDWMQANGELRRRERQAALARMRWALTDLATNALQQPDAPGVSALIDKVVARDLDPRTAASLLLNGAMDRQNGEFR